MQSSAFPNTFMYLCFYFSMGRCAYDLVVCRWCCAYFVPVYCNSLLGTLNVRQAIRGRAHNDLGISLRVIGESGDSSKNNRGVCACAIVPRSSLSNPWPRRFASRQRLCNSSREKRPAVTMGARYSLRQTISSPVKGRSRSGCLLKFPSNAI